MKNLGNMVSVLACILTLMPAAGAELPAKAFSDLKSRQFRVR